MIRPTIPPILNEDAVDERAADLEAAALNGLRMLRVTFDPPAAPGTGPDEARVEVWFHNTLHLEDVFTEATASPAAPGQVFRIRGGQRVPAGPGTDEVRVRSVAVGETDAGGDPVSLVLTVAPIGDYSTYTLELLFDDARIDPWFAELGFRFRPGCFTRDCDLAPTVDRPPRPAPAIDYLARDYDSFRHLLITSMMERVPGWQPTSEADLDQTLIDLLAAAGDELADYQDRVMGEAYLASARSRVSLARHARLVDYHVHQGNQASTWVALRLDDTVAPFTLDEELVVWAGRPGETLEDIAGDTLGDTPDASGGRTVFATRETVRPASERGLLDPVLNDLHLHTWSHARPALPGGTTSADLVSGAAGAGQPEAERVRDLIRDGALRHLLLEEKLDPDTGRLAGRDPGRRQLLRLLPDAEVLWDPLTDTWITRVSWRPDDALRSAYAFTTTCPTGRVEQVSVFHGNLLRVHEGRPVEVHFHPPDAERPADTADVRHRAWEPWQLWGETRGVRCVLPEGPLAYLPTPPGGERPPRSTARVAVQAGSTLDPWDEVTDLVHSDDSAENGDHFVVETDEHGQSVLRFGDGTNGRLLTDDAVVRCRYQTGGGVGGNVGSGVLIHPDGPASVVGAIRDLWNPFDVTNGRDPEPRSSILRRAPEAYRVRQLRAVTLADYVARAEEVDGVERAVARYAWTGSWRTVRVVIDPAGALSVDPALTAAVSRHLEAVRLLGEDLEIRPPRYVPLAVEVEVCLQPHVWAADVRGALLRELSTGWTDDGRRGLFHPDRWTFGQPLHASEVTGRLQAVSGVDHVRSLRMCRFVDAVWPEPALEKLDVEFDEIVLVENDPDRMEGGWVTLRLQGGRS